MIRLALAMAALGAFQPALAAYELEPVPGGEDRPRVLLAPRASPTATLVISFEAGSHDDGPSAGLTRLTQHALLAANRLVDYEALQLELHASAASLRIETGVRRSAFVLTAHRDVFPGLARRLLEAVLAPRLDSQRLHVAVGRLVHEAHQQSAEEWMFTTVASTALADGRYQNEPFGQRTAIESIAFQEVARHAAARLAPANATVVAAGGFDRAAVKLALHRFRGGRAMPPTRERLNVPLVSTRPSRGQVLLAAYALQIRSPRDAAAARILAELCRNELWRSFREAGSGYTFLVSAIPAGWLDLFVVTLPGRDRSALDLRPFLRRAVERVRTLDVPDDALSGARAQALAEIARADADPESLARALAAGGVDWHGAATAGAIGSLDRAALAEVARLLDPGASVEITFSTGGAR